MANRLVDMAEEKGLDFEGVPPNARDGILASIDRCFQILGLDYESPFRAIEEKSQSTVGWLMMAALSDIAHILLFVSYPDDGRLDGGERVRLDEAKASELRRHLAIIWRHGEVMAVAGLSTVVAADEDQERRVSVADIIQTHSAKPLLVG